MNEEQFLVERFAERVFAHRQWLLKSDFSPGMDVRDSLMALLLEYRECVGWPKRSTLAAEPPSPAVAVAEPWRPKVGEPVRVKGTGHVSPVAELGFIDRNQFRVESRDPINSRIWFCLDELEPAPDASNESEKPE